MPVNRSPAFFELAKAAKMRGGLPTLSGRPIRQLTEYTQCYTRSNGEVRVGRRGMVHGCRGCFALDGLFVGSLEGTPTSTVPDPGASVEACLRPLPTTRVWTFSSRSPLRAVAIALWF